MITTLALLTLASAGSVTDEPTPIDSSMIEYVIADSSVSGPACDAYRTVRGLVGELGLDYESTEMFVDLIDGWSIVTMESDSIRLDNGARDTLLDWLHTSCS